MRLTTRRDHIGVQLPADWRARCQEHGSSAAWRGKNDQFATGCIEMARMLLLFGALLLGLSIVNGGVGGWDMFPLSDERLMWAALLPGVYLVGLFLLRD
jgi:hypothetical protein